MSLHARIHFRQGVQVSLTKSSEKLRRFFIFLFIYFFLVLSLFYRSQMVNFEENYHFSRFQRGSNIIQGRSNFFQGGSNCLFPIETHITCDFYDFPGGSGPPVPPLDPHLVCHFPIGILGQVWYLFVSIPDLCTLTYFKASHLFVSILVFISS